MKKMHISLYVKDISKTVGFYTTMFNQEAEKVKLDYAKFELEEPALVISFVQNEEKVQPSFGHLGIRVDSSEEVIARLEKAKEMGIEVIEEMGVSCCYAEQDKFWMKDPDGHMWEIYSFTKDMEFNDPRYSTNESEACCTPVKEEKVKVSIAEVNSCSPQSGCC